MTTELIFFPSSQTTEKEAEKERLVVRVYTLFDPLSVSLDIQLK